MELRHEWKHQISYPDLLTLRRRLGAVMSGDVHAVGGRYSIRSLYFDTPTDRALLEKLSGTDRREKFRIRLYNGDLSFLRLEKKVKWGDLCGKETAPVTVPQVRSILAGQSGWMAESSHPLIRELYVKMNTQRLRPKTVVDYTREPFVFPPGNVRVTLDYDLRTGLAATDLLDPGLPTVPAGDAPVLLEVKWDRFLPDLIRQAVQLGSRRPTSFSKYAQCRIYD